MFELVIWDIFDENKVGLKFDNSHRPYSLFVFNRNISYICLWDKAPVF